jgi:hypothetical protein
MINGTLGTPGMCELHPFQYWSLVFGFARIIYDCYYLIQWIEASFKQAISHRLVRFDRLIIARGTDPIYDN